MTKLIHTVNCINELRVTVIAGTEHEVNALIRSILTGIEEGALLMPSGNGNSLPTVADVEKQYLSCKQKPQIVCVALNKIAPSCVPASVSKSPSWQCALAVAELVAFALARGVRIVAVLPSGKRSDCISVFRKIPESVKDEVQILLLENLGEEYRLWIEAGAKIGAYVPYEYDSETKEFKEKE